MSNYDIRLDSKENVIHFANLYYSWLLNCYSNGIELTGNVIGFFNH